MKRNFHIIWNNFSPFVLFLMGIIAMIYVVTRTESLNSRIQEENPQTEDISRSMEKTDEIDKEVDSNIYAAEYNAKLSNCVNQSTTTWDIFYKYIRIAKKCKNTYVFGGQVARNNKFDGHKAVCMDEGYKPLKNKCTVLSFGINTDWSFDDSFDSHGCKVYCFDPTIYRNRFDRSDNIHFYPIGLSDHDYKTPEKHQVYMTYHSILKELGLLGHTIDYLKIDIEGHEIEFFEDIFKNYPQLLRFVKQIGIQIHPGRSEKKRNQFWNIFHELNCLQFRPIYYEQNMFNQFQYKDTTEATCYELVWVNDVFKTRK